MASCAHCGTVILFGGKRSGTRRYCGDACYSQGETTNSFAQYLTPEDIQQRVFMLQGENCPQCGGPGPLNLHTSYYVTSVVVMTFWNESPKYCCRSCGNKARAIGIVYSMCLGWWGFPFGLVLTPVQIIRNIVGLFGRDDLVDPRLHEIAREQLATEMQLAYAHMQAQQNEPPPQDPYLSQPIARRDPALEDHSRWARPGSQSTEN